MTTTDQPRCECPEEMLVSPPLAENYTPEEKKAWGHTPNECPSTSQLWLYRRGAKIVRLCSACTTRTDAPLTGPLLLMSDLAPEQMPAQGEGCCIFCHKKLATEGEHRTHIMNKHPHIIDAFIMWVIRRSSPLRYQAAYANEFVWRGPDSDAAD